MPATARLAERAGALGLFGAALFNQPLIAAFDGMAAGIPVVFLYVFGVWAAMIALLARVMLGAPATGPQGGPPDDGPPGDGRPEGGAADDARPASAPASAPAPAPGPALAGG